jgi:hypothetical protein
MKLNQELSEVEIEGAESQPKQFNILASREVFKLLSSGIYNDQILAVVRELSCNAYDSHVQAGKKDVPFEIHLPTVFEQYFSVKDFGVGLSEKEVMDLYCTYGGSNRSDSNLFVGAFGVGSKSPFAYTEGFTVISRYNGTSTVYSCFFDESGYPTVVKQTEEPTEECNGLTVQFPVNKKDLDEFQSKAEIALEFFNPQPILNKKVYINKTEYSLKAETWGVRKNAHTHHTSQLRAIQGMVQYAVGNIDESRMNEAQKMVMHQPIDLFFNIGDLAVAASRETLSNDERTIGNILKAIETIAATYLDDAKKKLKEAGTEWKARIQINKYINSYYDNMDKIVRDAWFRGDLDGDYGSFKLDHKKAELKLNQFDYPLVTMSKFQRSNGYSKTEADRSLTFYTEERRAEVAKLIAEKKREKKYEDKEFEPRESILFVLGDVPFGGTKYIHYFLQVAQDNKNVTQVYLISRANKNVGPEVVVREGKKIISQLGNPPFLLLSQLKEKYRPLLDKEKETVEKKELMYFDMNQNVGRYRDEAAYWRKAWEPVVEVEDDVYDIPEGRKFFLPLKKLQPTTFKYEYADQLKALITAARGVGILQKDELIYGMPESGEVIKETQKIKKEQEWVEFSKYVWDELLKIITPELEMQLSLMTKAFDPGDLKLLFPRMKKELDPTNPFIQFIKSYEEASKIDKKKAEHMPLLLAEAAKHGKHELKSTKDFSKEWKDLLSQYPLLPHIGYYRYDENRKQIENEILNYIRMKDEKRREEDLLMCEHDVIKLLIEGNVLQPKEQEKESNDVIQ